MANEGYIKLDRKLLKWRWYKDGNTVRVFLHILLTANYADSDFENITVCRGQLVTSYKAISDSLGISVQSTRTAIKHLKSTGEITVETFPKYSVITVKNYGLYQNTNNLFNNRITSGQQTANKQPTTSKEEKEYKEEKEIKKSIGTKKFVPPTLEEVREYCLGRGNNVDPEKFLDFYQANGWVQGRGKPIKDWKACVRTWEKGDGLSGHGKAQKKGISQQHDELDSHKVPTPEEIERYKSLYGGD